MAKVFITQQGRQRQPNGTVVLHDYSPAKEYGELRLIVAPGPFDSKGVWEDQTHLIEDRLRDFQPEDYLILTGDPLIAALSFAAAIANLPPEVTTINTLKWDRDQGRYVPQSNRIPDFG